MPIHSANDEARRKELTNVRFGVVDAAEFHEPEAYELITAFDAIHARVALQFVPDPAAALREFRRVLTADGRVYVSVPGALSPIYGRAWQRFVNADGLVTNRLVPWELAALLAHLGWEVLDGWGSFGTTMSGDANPLSAETVAPLDVRLQQAAATTWAFIARPGR